MVSCQTNIFSTSSLLLSYPRYLVGSIKSFTFQSSANIYKDKSGLSVRTVEIFAFVTSLEEKQEFHRFNVDDGTGTIQCMVQKLKSTGNRTISPSNTMLEYVKLREKNHNPESEELTSYLQCMLDATNAMQDFSNVRLGDIVLIQGHLSHSKWKNDVQIICDKIKLMKDHNVLDEWTDWLNNTVYLNDSIYKSSVCDINNRGKFVHDST